MPDRPTDRQRLDRIERVAREEPDVNLVPATELPEDRVLDALYHLRVELHRWRDRALQAEDALDALEYELEVVQLPHRPPRPFHEL